MTRWKRRTIFRCMRPLLLVGLLLVPIVASGHVHAAHTSTQPCAACVVTQHSPAMSAPTAPGASATTLALDLEARPAAAPRAPAPRDVSVRGPPRVLLGQQA